MIKQENDRIKLGNNTLRMFVDKNAILSWEWARVIVRIRCDHGATPVSTHFNQPGHSINDILLIPLELIHNNRDSVRKAREAHLRESDDT